MQITAYGRGEHVFCDGTVCLIDDIRTLSFAADTGRLYYVLRPISGGSSKIYLPVDGEEAAGRLRYLISREQIDRLLADVRGRRLEWQPDRKMRVQEQHDILAAADHEQLLLLIGCIHSRRLERRSEGKDISSGDENAMQAAEKLICEEFRYSLGLDAQQTGEYIRSALGIE